MCVAVAVWLRCGRDPARHRRGLLPLPTLLPLLPLLPLFIHLPPPPPLPPPLP